jgi:predicted house-cleaning NTP pyrophosphatase (Maf/HAM1 superfamily)
MIRTQICLTKKEKSKLEQEAKETGISMAELIRRILDEYFKKEDNK